ncbi:MAG: ABC transporter ATP-binding protein [Acidobacteriota bacterium]
MIKTFGLTKEYKRLTALKDLSIEVHEGDIYGFIGPNGAGKSTTLKILATLLLPTRGTAFIAGKSVVEDPYGVRRLIGYMPDFFGVYTDMEVEEYLRFFAAAYDIRGERQTKIVGDVLELTDLGGKRGTLIGSLSRGMQQRLGLARVLVHDPQVLLLDEPASGLDPRARVEIREILKELMSMGKTILISSHILSELAELCTRIGIIERGDLKVQGPIDEVMKKLGRARAVIVELDVAADQALPLLQACPLFSEVVASNGGTNQVRCTLTHKDMDLALVSEYIWKNGLRLRHFAEDRPSLEQAFMDLTEGKVA